MPRALVSILLGLALIQNALAQGPAAYRAPLAYDGRPDLQGVWSSDWLTTLERPPEITGLTISPGDMPTVAKAIRDRRDASQPLEYFPLDFREFMVIDGAARSSIVVDPADGRIPYGPDARARMLKPSPPPGMDGPEQRPTNERCLWSAGLAPNLPGLPNFQTIVQTRDSIVLLGELFGQLRIVPLDGRADPIGLPHGRMSGRWEGEALVIETTAIPAPFRGSLNGGFALTPQTRITERFVRSGPDEISYSFAVDDPQLYAKPWKAEMVMRRTVEPVFESACHEGNYGLANILSGARAEERRGAGAKTGSRP
jgi:hypothetical protein